MFSRAVLGAAATSAGVGLGLSVQQASSASNSTANTLNTILEKISAIENDLGLGQEESAYPQMNVKINTVDVDNFPRYFRSSCSGRCLTKADYKKFANVVGPRGYTFDMAIQCGIDTKSGTGFAIPDEESYYLWKEFYDKVMDECHGGYPAEATHTTDLDYKKIDSSKLPADLNKYCISTRIRAARNVSGFALPPASSRAERRTVEKLCQEGLESMTGPLGGKYYSLSDMSQEDEDQLQADHFLFQKPDPNAMISGCGGIRDWPDGRGIFHNKEKTFLVWVNEEDQMRVISMQKGGNVVEVFQRWADGVNAVEKVINSKGYEYMYNEHTGMFSSCVSNLGTGLRASMHILLPKSIDQIGILEMENLAAAMEMQCRGAGGEHTAAGPGGRVDMSNARRIGRSEVQLVQTMVDGICTFIDLEKKAERGEDIRAEVAAIIAAKKN